MSWMCSWIAVRGVTRGELLLALDLAETEEEDLPGCHEAPMCCGDRNGWVIVYSDDYEWGVDRERLQGLSRLGFALGSQYNDKVDASTVACAAQDGVELWRVNFVAGY